MWNCANYGDIKSANGCAAGLVANGDANIYYNCYNTGTITGSGTNVFRYRGR